MKRFLAVLFLFILGVVIFFLGYAIICAIAESDLPFWVKLWLLRG